MYNLVIFCVAAINSVVSVSVNDSSKEIARAILELSNAVIQERQSHQTYDDYYSKIGTHPSYSQYYQPQKYQYGYPQYDPTNSLPNEVYRPEYHYPPTKYPYYPIAPSTTHFAPSNPQFFEKTKESVMDALFSIAQNDDLQCVPKLLCELTSGGLMGRQAGFNLPVNVNLESVTTFLGGLNSASMSPVLHFGKAALLGFASKGSTRTCQNSYPECPRDPEKLIQYLNNHNGGFFRFFQGLNPSQNSYSDYAPQYFNGYRPAYFGKQAIAQKRIQNQPTVFANHFFGEENSGKEHRGLKFPQNFYTTPISYETTGSRKVIFPKDYENEANNYVIKSGSKSFKFPSDYATSDHPPYRGGKALTFDPYPPQTNDNSLLDIQRPPPNHVPVRNIFPDRTGTGELKLDLDELENNYQQSVAYDHRLLYDSFPNDYNKKRKYASYLSFPAR